MSFVYAWFCVCLCMEILCALYVLIMWNKCLKCSGILQACWDISIMLFDYWNTEYVNSVYMLVCMCVVYQKSSGPNPGDPNPCSEYMFKSFMSMSTQFWILLGMDTPKHPWTTCSSVWPPSQGKEFFSCLSRIPVVLVCARCLLFFYWITLGVCLHLVNSSFRYLCTLIRPLPAIFSLGPALSASPYTSNASIP